jgi:Cu-Zn family superoxide dismutase
MQKLFITLLVLSFSQFAKADTISTQIYSTSEPNNLIGNIRFEDSDKGLIIYPDLNQLTAGLHGMHIHEKPSCDKHGDAAGAHLDPMQSKTHLGPYHQGHLGDLPALTVDAEGRANLPVIAPNLSTKAIKNHSIIIHENGDNYSNTPPLGGGGARIACGTL